MAVDGALGSLLQGVSQQPPRVRPSGKVSKQENFISDVVQGLTARPALHESALIENFAATALNLTSFKAGEVYYVLGYKDNTLYVWDTEGTAYPVIEDDTNALNYIGTEMRTYVFEDNLYLANRDVVTAKAASATGAADAYEHTALISVLGGNYSRKYTVSVTWHDGTVSTGIYTTPDGDTAGDADKTASSYIADELLTSLKADSTYKGNAVDGISEGTFFVHNPSGSISVIVSDDDSDITIRAHARTVENTTDLAKTAPHGTLVKVVGEDAGSEDDYYLRFNSATTDTVGSGFGDEGVWEEWTNVAEVSEWDQSTMPHILYKNGSNFHLKYGAWEARKVGDGDSNAFPDIIGYPVRDIGGFQSRLAMVGGPWLVMSQTNEPLNFFKKSALAEVDTDPISISSTQEGTVRLDWIIPFDRDLVLMSDPGKGQFIVSGATKITPGTASMVSTTAFEMRGGAKPVETGRTILFPFKSGIYSGVKEFFTNDEVATNGADTLTETVDRYIVGLIDHMVCSTNFNMAFIKTDEPTMDNVVYVYKYLWQNTEKLQSAWSKWIFPNTVEHFFFEGSQLHVIMSEPGTVADTTNIIMVSLDLDIPVDAVAGYHVCLDRQVTETAIQGSTVTLPYQNATFIQSTGCPAPGRPVSPISTGGVAGAWTYTFDTEDVPDLASVICGIRYNRSVKPTMPFVRDRNGRVRPRTALVVTAFNVEYEETGYMKSEMTSRYRSTPTVYDADWFQIDGDPDMENGIRSGVFSIPWGERADWSELELSSDDPRPTTILDIEWVGQIQKGSTA